MLDLLYIAIGVYETLAERNMISATGDGIVWRMFIKAMILDFILICTIEKQAAVKESGTASRKMRSTPGALLPAGINAIIFISTAERPFAG
jgi:hypothetical protein